MGFCAKILRLKYAWRVQGVAKPVWMVWGGIKVIEKKLIEAIRGNQAIVSIYLE